MKRSKLWVKVMYIVIGLASVTLIYTISYTIVNNVMENRCDRLWDTFHNLESTKKEGWTAFFEFMYKKCYEIETNPL